MDKDTDAIAIVGMAGRFPGARNVSELWSNVCAGKHSVRYFSDEELRDAGVPAAQIKDPNYVRAGAVIDDVDRFDCGFFGYSPRDAALIDPQQRLFLECAVHALEDAGIDYSSSTRRIGVFAGSAISPYLVRGGKDDVESSFSPDSMAFGTANDKDYVATRVSYCLDLTGPSVTVQSACSTSLLAVHLAWRSILNGECDIALAGGVSVAQGRQLSGYQYAPGGVLSKDGLCRPFDASASGTIFGDGLGIVVLQRLSNARADRRHIRAIIRASAAANDGNGKLAFAAPSVEGQARTIRAALDLASLKPSEIDYIEAHGTGTELGDRIEIEALRNVFGADAAVGRCVVGSVKANIGHLNTAAGVAGLIKAVLVVENALAPPMANFTAPHPALKLADGPMVVPSEPCPIAADGRPLRAGINAFGIGGTNVHVIIEAYPQRSAEPLEELRSDDHLLLLSTRSPESLDGLREDLAAGLDGLNSRETAELATALSRHRPHYPVRQFLVRSRDKIVFTSQVGDDGQHKSRIARRPRKVVFLFPGQGLDVAAPSEQLLKAHPVLERSYRRACSIAHRVARECGVDPLDGSNRPINPATGWSSVFDPVVLAAFAYSLGRMLQEWGVAPAAMVGHSLGEYVAAVLGDVLTLEEMISLITRRALLMEGVPAGAMIGVPLPENDAVSRFGDNLDLAVSTSKSFSVLSGSVIDIRQAQQSLAECEIDAIVLKAPVAFHSRLMDGILAPFAECCRDVPSRKPAIPFTSGLDGRWYVAHEPCSYWPQHMRDTMRMDACIRRVKEEVEPDLLVQLGPGATFQRTVQETWDRQAPAIYSPFSADGSINNAGILAIAGQLWLNGINLDWSAIMPETQAGRIPPYPFERGSFWLTDTTRGTEKVFPSLANEPRIFEPTWLRRRPAYRADAVSGRLLVFCREDQLRSQPGNAVGVIPGGAFARHGANHYTIDISDPSHYERLFEDLAERDLWPTHIRHLLLLGDRDSESDERVVRGYQSLMHVGKGFAASCGDQSPAVHLIAYTDAAFRVDDRDRPLSGDAMIASACLGLQQEITSITCQLVDLPSGHSCEHLPRISSRDGLVIAVRNGYCWSRDIHPLLFDSTAPLVKPGKTYVISGGLGGIGQLIAKHLIDNYQATVILTGRSAPETLDVAKRQAISKLGEKAHYAELDPANPAAWTRLFNYPAAAPGVAGIFHLAGNAAGVLIDNWTAAASDRVLEPKVAGTRALVAACREHQLDFVVLFSSLAASLGGFGRADYAAANTYLDIAAENHEGGDCKLLSIAWDFWADIGMAHPDRIGPQQVAQQMQVDAIALDPKEALTTLFRLIDQYAPTATIVSKRDVQKDQFYWHAVKLSAVLSRAREQATGGATGRPANSRPYVKPDTDVQKIVAQLWEDTLGISPIGADDDFFEFGGHSLAVIGLTNAIRKQLSIAVSTRDFYEHRTVAGLSQIIEMRMIEALEAAHPEEVKHHDPAFSRDAAALQPAL